MANEGICYAILVAIVSLTLVLIRNGTIIKMLSQQMANMIAISLTEHREWRCQYRPQPEERHAEKDTSGNPRAGDCGPMRNDGNS